MGDMGSSSQPFDEPEEPQIKPGKDSRRPDSAESKAEGSPTRRAHLGGRTGRSSRARPPRRPAGQHVALVDVDDRRNMLAWLQRQTGDIVRAVLGQLRDWRILRACGMLCAAFRAAVIGEGDADDSLVWEACTRAFWGARDARGVQRYVPHWIWELAFDRRRFREAFAWAMADSRRESITVEELTSLPWEKRSKPEEVHDPNDAWVKGKACSQTLFRRDGSTSAAPGAPSTYEGTLLVAKPYTCSWRFVRWCCGTRVPFGAALRVRVKRKDCGGYYDFPPSRVRRRALRGGSA